MNPVDLVRELADALERRERACHDSLHDDDWYSARAEFAPSELLTRARAFLEQARVIEVSKCTVHCVGSPDPWLEDESGDFHMDYLSFGLDFDPDATPTVHVVVQVGGER